MKRDIWTGSAAQCGAPTSAVHCEISSPLVECIARNTSGYFCVLHKPRQWLPTPQRRLLSFRASVDVEQLLCSSYYLYSICPLFQCADKKEHKQLFRFESNASPRPDMHFLLCCGYTFLIRAPINRCANLFFSFASYDLGYWWTSCWEISCEKKNVSYFQCDNKSRVDPFFRPHSRIIIQLTKVWFVVVSLIC